MTFVASLASKARTLLVANIVTTSKVLVTTSVALVSTSFLLLLVRHLLLLAWHLLLEASFSGPRGRHISTGSKHLDLRVYSDSHRDRGESGIELGSGERTGVLARKQTQKTVV